MDDPIGYLPDEERQVCYVADRVADLLGIGRDYALNAHALSEALDRAALTLGHEPQAKGPDEIKQAAHKAFWIRKLKPFTPNINLTINDEHGLRVGHMFFNEMIALMFALGIVEMFGHHPRIYNDLCHDFVTSMRYSSYSPSSMRTILQVLCDNQKQGITA